jgi:glycosyltransferase involved in cell wall biosynthesis
MFRKPIEVFVRYCNYSEVSAKKQRPAGFSHKACYNNLLATIDSRVNLTFFLDTKHPGNHFIRPRAIEIQEGTEAGSFLRMIEHVVKLPLKPDTIVYFLEDDYLHRPGWVDVLLEGFTLPADYVTLYDHRDKYRDYPDLFSKLFLTSSCHWRTTPSTTNTYAMRFKTFQKHYSIHEQFSLQRRISSDHDKFIALGKEGGILISPIPGYSTHAEPEYLTPFFKETPCTPSRWIDRFPKISSWFCSPAS